MVLADAIARWKRCLLTTGTDEHGIKVLRAAEARGVSVEQFTGETSAAFRALADSLGVGYGRFVRTTEVEHVDTVYGLWNRLVGNGAIYKGEHAEWYLTTEERFRFEYIRSFVKK
jgi:methionyl-tRNA synthetase